MGEVNGYMSDQDIFADEDSQQPILVSPKTPVKAESEELSRLRGLMGGIPPPPEKTNPQIDVNGMLEAWNANLQLHLEVINKIDNIKKNKKDFKNKKKIEVITNRDIKLNFSLSDCDKENFSFSDDDIDEEKKRFDIYLNLDTEEEESLRLKVAERLISHETSSSFVHHVILTNSAKKRQRRNGWAKSPGSRLSYLAKRRTTFCQRPGLAGSRTISILKDDKKPTKDKKPMPLKRALFQSPDKIDFSTPDCSRIKRLKLSIPSPTRETPPRNERQTHLKRKPSVSRNLETTFNKFVAQTNPDLMNPRQKQLWQRTPLSSLPS